MFVLRKLCVYNNPMRKLKWAYQRIKRGWSDRDAWGAHYHLTNVMIGMLQYLVKSPSGFPYSFKNVEEWQAKLNEIIAGLEAGRRVGETDYPEHFAKLEKIRPFGFEHLNDPQTDEEKELWKEFKKVEDADYKSFKKAMGQLTKYYFSLWD